MDALSPIVQSAEVDDLYAGIVQAFGALHNIATDGSANTGTYSYTYMTLGAIMSAIRQPLAAAGLAVIQAPSVSRSPNGVSVDVTTRLLHTSGQWVEGTVSIAVAAGVNAQGIGSAITYGRRYGLTAMLGIASGEDDDGAAAASAPPSYDDEAMRRDWMPVNEAKVALLQACGDKDAASALWASDAPPTQEGWVRRSDVDALVSTASRRARAERAQADVDAQVAAVEATA